ncbi:ATPase family protein associated with various cellular activities (AAA) [Azospirillum brasilense]|uniref:ATPase family protein associated with various cellular activities (AAA) n=1 Tax=Azospirillum brasilense TaxID=192 RepID=A0A560B1H2_AZOBR|nr:ATP-binding protein [Azospirillum brasilense]TWA66476.1 ATPase family protein associated with various cellular activities (AAA) [Azospirillum brasilense]
MSRSDLVIKLVEAGAQGDRPMLRRTVEAIVAEERAKQHHTFADRLSGALASVERAGPKAVAGTHLPDRVREFVVEVPARRALAELVLPEHVQEACDELIGEQRSGNLLRAHGLEPRHRVLLAGPPGNGKTSLAEALAEALAVPFFVVRYESVIGSYLGETATRLKRVFDYARTTPCVLFFDEFDAVGKERGDLHETGEIKRVVSSLLLQVDDLPSYTVVVCATNHPELLDRAVWRRFQLRLELPNPSQDQLKRWFETFLSRLDGKVGFSAAALSSKFRGASFAEVEQFSLDVQRRLVLSLGAMTARDALARQLQQWTRRFVISADAKERDGDQAPNPPPQTHRRKAPQGRPEGGS